MTFTNRSFQRAVDELSAECRSIRVADPSQEEEIHAILESTGMTLGRGLELFYSRRPSLQHSWLESFRYTAVFVDEAPVTFVSALSEVDLWSHGKKQTGYYASDLRFTRNATARSRRTFAEYYRKLVQALPEGTFCYTAILDENAVALRRLKGRSFPLAYNEAFSYMARSWVTLPSIGFHRRIRLKGFEIRRVLPEDGPAVERFLLEQMSCHALSNDVLASRSRFSKDTGSEWVVTFRGTLVGFCATHRPQGRSLRVRAQSRGARLLAQAVKLLSGDFKGTGKLPWVYVSALVLDERLKAEADFLPAFFQTLVREGAVRMGDIVLLVHPNSEDACFSASASAGSLLHCPQIIQRAKIYIVDPEPEDRRMGGNIHLDPTSL